MSSAPSLQRELKTNYLFSALSETQMDHLKRHVRQREYAPNTALFHEQQPARHFFLLLEGQIKLYRLSPQGGEKIIELIHPGETFATAVMFRERKDYPVTAEALKACRVISIESKPFLDILRESPETCFRIMADMSRRLHSQVRELDQISLQSAPARLAGYLISELGDSQESKATVRLSASKRVIAARLSIQPETLSRILKQFRQDNLIQTEGSLITILDSEKLREISEQ